MEYILVELESKVYVEYILVELESKVYVEYILVEQESKVYVEYILVERRVQSLRGIYIGRARVQSLRGIYIGRARVQSLRGIYIGRVISNGIFHITPLNVTESDIVVKSRKIMGFIYPIESVANRVNTVNETKELDKTCDAVPYGDNLNHSEKCQLRSLIHQQSLIHEFGDIFVTDPNNPKLTHLAEHGIITNDALPVKQKPRRMPKAWENELYQQFQEMLNNQIIRLSQSPWNSPIILVKKTRQHYQVCV